MGGFDLERVQPRRKILPKFFPEPARARQLGGEQPKLFAPPLIFDLPEISPV